MCLGGKKNHTGKNGSYTTPIWPKLLQFLHLNLFTL